MSIVYNDYVKRPGEEDEYTPGQIKSLVKCRKDIFEFLPFVKVVHPDRGRVVFEPWEFQTDIIKMIDENRFSVVMCARQQGKSTMAAIYLLWYAIFNRDKLVGVVSNVESGAIDILDRIKVMYEELPMWMKPGIIEYNKKTIKFENGSIIRASATSKDSFRGRTCNIVFCDELAFVDPQWKADEFFTSNWPTISASKESKFIVVSTPKGIGNIFHTMFTESEKGLNTFKHYKADWTHHPERDAEWALEQRKNLGSKRFNQEFGIQFLGSDSTVLDEGTLKRLDAQPMTDPVALEGEGHFKIYEKPVEGAHYILGVDCAKGTGEHSSTIQVLRMDSISPIKLKQVAVFEDNKTDTFKFAEIINRSSYYYNNAHILCENNGEGSAVISQLWWEYENSNLVNEGSKITKLGVRATKISKPKAVLLMKKLIEEEALEIVDYPTILQLMTFIDKNGRFTGDGSPDDLVSALYWAPFIFTMDILEESMSFENPHLPPDDDSWNFLSDFDDVEEDWSWLTQ